MFVQLYRLNLLLRKKYTKPWKIMATLVEPLKLTILWEKGRPSPLPDQAIWVACTTHNCHLATGPDSLIHGFYRDVKPTKTPDVLVFWLTFPKLFWHWCKHLIPTSRTSGSPGSQNYSLQKLHHHPQSLRFQIFSLLSFQWKNTNLVINVDFKPSSVQKQSK